MSWYALSIVSLVLFGIQRFFFKVAAENKCSTKLLTLAFMITVFILSSLVFVVTSRDFANLTYVLVFAFFNGSIFLLQNVFQLESLKRVPSTVAFPLYKLSTPLVVGFSFFYLREALSATQMISILLGIVAVYLLGTRDHDERTKYQDFRLGMILVAGAVLAASASQVISKYAAIADFDPLLYISLSYLYNSLFIYAFHGVKHGRKAMISGDAAKRSIYYGILIGVTNFAAFYTYLHALAVGTLSLVTVVSSFSLAIPVVLSVIWYKDKLGLRRIIGIGLVIVALMMMQG